MFLFAERLGTGSMDQPGFDVGDHVLAILRSLDVGGLDRDVAGRSAVCDRPGMRHDAGAVVGSLDVEAIGAFGHGPIVLVGEVPGEGLDAALAGVAPVKASICSSVSDSAPTCCTHVGVQDGR